MQMGWIGLGKMGWNLCLNLLDHGFDLTVYNRNPEKAREMAVFGAVAALSIEDLAMKLRAPRIIWLMVTAGEAVDEILENLEKVLEPGDLVVDGGNSHYKDSLRRGRHLEEKGIGFMDVGTSGGIEGARRGACMMAGGAPSSYGRISPILEKICVDKGFGHIGPLGSGHYVKMVHNGIEYGMMQALGEGFEIMDGGDFDIDFKALSEIWNHGSIIEGYLVETMVRAFEIHGDLAKIKGVVESSGEGRWAVEEALERGISTPVMAISLLERYRSRQEETYSGKVLAALRNTFGGHRIHEKQ